MRGYCLLWEWVGIRERVLGGLGMRGRSLLFGRRG